MYSGERLPCSINIQGQRQLCEAVLIWCWNFLYLPPREAPNILHPVL